jgi:hypothetical protein
VFVSIPTSSKSKRTAWSSSQVRPAVAGPIRCVMQGRRCRSGMVCFHRKPQTLLYHAANGSTQSSRLWQLELEPRVLWLGDGKCQARPTDHEVAFPCCTDRDFSWHRSIHLRPLDNSSSSPSHNVFFFFVRYVASATLFPLHILSLPTEELLQENTSSYLFTMTRIEELCRNMTAADISLTTPGDAWGMRTAVTASYWSLTNSMEQNPSSEANIHSASQEISRHLGSLKLITVFTRPRHWTLS